MFARHPEIAKRWAKKYGVPKNLPKYKGRKKYVAITKGQMAKKKPKGKKK